MKNETKLQIFKSLVALSIPTILEEMLATLLQYVDTAMVGQLGENATAAVSVTTTVSWLIGSICSALGIATLSLISKAVGSGDKERIRGLSGHVLLLAVGCGIVVGSIAMLLSPFIPAWMGAEQSIQKNASLYFLIICIPMVFRAYNSILGAAIRATKDTKTPMFINLGANILNVVLNYLMIYEMDMGVIGAAIATAISYTVSGSLMYVAYRRNQLLFWERKSFRFDATILADCAKLSIPVMATNVTSCLGYVVFASLVTGMGTTVFAAHSIAVTAETIFYIPGYGLRTATSALVGISLGEGSRRKFENISCLSVALTMGMMIVSGVILYLVAHPLMSLFTNSSHVADIGADMLKLVAFSEPFFGLMVVMEGVYYGLGRTKYTFWVTTLSMWGVRILFTWLCVRFWNQGLTQVWYCMIADNVCKAVLLAFPMLFAGRRKALFPADAGSGS